MSVVKVQNLSKNYDSFKLNAVSFDIDDGRITGFIGKNGAGKTTTIKAMLNLINSDSGEILYFNKSLINDESNIKKLIGYSTGTVNWYPRKKIKNIVSVVKRFYETWDDSAYYKYLHMFNLDENKTPMELSEGMKVKFNLLLALSHNAKILILDEPTSGLDPFSRNELLDTFVQLKNDGVSILFSTHIISDIERCADDIIYISEGSIVASMTKQDFQSKFAKANENLEDIIIRMERSSANA